MQSTRLVARKEVNTTSNYSNIKLICQKMIDSFLKIHNYLDYPKDVIIT